MTTAARLIPMLLALTFSCGDAADPNPRLQAAIVNSCEQRVSCESSSWLTVEQCVDDQNLLLSVFHYMHGAKCIDAYIEVSECQLSYDCELFEALSRCVGQSSCDRQDPCAHLQEPAWQACGAYDFLGGRGVDADAD